MRKAVIALHAAAVLVFTGLTAALWNDIDSGGRCPVCFFYAAFRHNACGGIYKLR